MKQSRLPQFSLVAVRELGKTQAFEDGLTNISFCKQATLAARLAMSNVDLKITHFLFKVRHLVLSLSGISPELVDIFLSI